MEESRALAWLAVGLAVAGGAALVGGLWFAAHLFQSWEPRSGDEDWAPFLVSFAVGACSVLLAAVLFAGTLWSALAAAAADGSETRRRFRR